MNDLAEFILEHVPFYQRWDRDIFDSWLTWHVGHGFVQKAIDFDGSIAGVIIVRTIMRPQDADDYYAFDPEGNVAFIDLAVATKPGALQAITIAGLQRYGQRDWVAWKRGPYYVTKFRETARVIRHILRKDMVYGR